MSEEKYCLLNRVYFFKYSVLVPINFELCVTLDIQNSYVEQRTTTS